MLKRKKFYILGAIVIFSIVVVLNLLQKDLWEVHADSLKEKVLSIESSIKTVNLNDITPFDWDTAYSFHPYTPKETIYETVGYKWDTISETVNEGMNQIVFLKDGKVVCYLYGYPENNGFGLNFTSINETEVPSASVLNSEENLTFQVVRSDDIVYLILD